MTIAEFSNEFDVLYNNGSNEAPGLDEYEKSVVLTKAEHEMVKNYFMADGNKYKTGFDGSQKRQYDFSVLMKSIELPLADVAIVDSVESAVRSDYLNGKYITSAGFDRRAISYFTPIDLFLVVNEQLIDNKTNFIFQIIPIRYDEYTREMMKPYKYPVKNAVWRLITGNIPGDILNTGGYNPAGLFCGSWHSVEEHLHEAAHGDYKHRP